MSGASSAQAIPFDPPTLRISPPRGWLDLHLKELWAARELLYFAISFLVFLGMMVWYHIKPGPALLLFPLFLLLAVLTALGVGLWLSAVNAIYRDVRYVVPFLVQFWMFASPVAYPSSLVP